MSTARRSSPKFKVGDWVSFLYGARRVLAQIIEDRGPIGVNRRRLYRVQMNLDPSEIATSEIPEDHLEAAPPPDKTKVPS